MRISGASAAPEFFSGSLATYTFTVSNAGPDAARNVTLQASPGAGQSLSAITCTAAGGATCPSPAALMPVPLLPSGGKLIFTIDASIAPGTVGPIGVTLHAGLDSETAPADNAATAASVARIPTSPQSGSFIALESDAGDYIGGGGSYDYSSGNALIKVTSSGGVLSVTVTGDQDWFANFAMPVAKTELVAGTYSDLRRYPFHNPVLGGLSWSGEGRGCNTLSGAFEIDSVTYVAGVLAAIDLRFEQHCEGGAAALRGQIHWTADDAVRPAGPVNPPPAGLWSPAPGATPTSGNYVYLQSDGGDYIGGGRSYTYTLANALLSLSSAGNLLTVGVSGDEGWGGEFQGMNVLTQLEPGFYGNLQRYPFNNPVAGGLSWSGEGRGCNTLKGWFVIDAVTYAAGMITALDMRFEQHCEGHIPALRGKIHWAAGDTTQPPGPQVPPPPGLWSPAPGTTPVSGNYVYIESPAGDYIGGGRTYGYTPANALLSVTSAGGRLDVSVQGNEGWSGNFQGMNVLSRLQPGYYGNLQRFPFHNPVAGGLSWSGEGRGCNTLSGWFVIDTVTYVGNAVASVDLRFEQRCEVVGPPLRGKIHWIQ